MIATADGDVTVSIREDAARDAAGNRNAESETIALTVDTERPSVGISTLTTSPTNFESIMYAVEFREEVNDFDAGDITASIAGSTPTVEGPISTIGNTQTFMVTHNSNEGILTVSIPENVATDNAGNNNTASELLTITVDRIAPTVDGASVSDTDTIILDISESLSESGGVASDFAISGVATNPSVASIDITGSTITLNLDDSITDADLPLVSYTGTAGSIEDLAENPLAAFTNRAVENEIDTTGPVPTLTITSEPGAVTHTNSTTVSYMVTFDMDVTGFDEDDIEVEGSANNGNPEASNFVTVDGDEYTFDVERGDSDGNVMVFIPADRAIDGSGNQNVASDRLEIIFDTISPTLTLASTESGDTKLRTIPFTVRFDEVVSGFDRNDIIIEGAATARQPTTSDDIFYEFDIVATSDGPVTVSIRENAARDMADNGNSIPENVTTDNAGNNNTASNELVHTVDRIAPTVVSASVSDTDTITLEISESVSGGIAFDFAISGVNSGPEVDSIDVTGSTITLNLDDSITDADLPLLSYTGTTGSIEDPATNPLANFASRTVTNDIDTTRPTVTLGTDPPLLTNSQTITYRVEFSESVTRFNATGIDVSGTSGGTAAEPTGAGRNYEFVVTRGISDGTVTVTILEGAARDADDNLSFASTPVEITVDATPPTVTAASVVNPNIIRLDISEQVSDNGATASDFAIAGAASNHVVSSLSASGSSVELSLAPPLTDADNPTVSYTRTAGGIEDAATNRLANFVSQAVTNNLDTTRPTVTSFTTTSSNPTNSQTITYAVQFSEPVTRFNATGIDVTGTSGGTAAEPTGTGRDYEFTLTRGASDGTVTVTILEGAARDVDMNLSFASSTVEIVVDATPPTVTGASVSDTDTIILEISEPVSGGAASDFTISGVNSDPVVNSIDVTGSTVTLNLDDSITDADNPAVSYTGTVDIEDAAENPLADFANESVTNNLDTTRPTVTSFTTTSSNPTNSQTITYTVQFSESVTGFSAAGIGVTGTSGGTVAEPTGTGRDYEFVVTRGASDGIVTVTILEGAARDEDDNLSFASSPVEITVDATPPTVTGAAVVNPNIIRLDISEPVSDNEAVASDFLINILNTPIDIVVNSISVSGSSVELSLAPPLTDADNPTVAYMRTAGGIEDPATNRLADFVPQAVTNNIDAMGPVGPITMLSTTDTFPTNSRVVQFRVNFTETVTFEVNKISVGGVTLGTADSEFTIMLDSPSSTNIATSMGPGRDFNFTLMYEGTDGTVPVYIPANSINTTQNIGNMKSNTIDAVFDFTDPEVRNGRMMNSTTIQLSMSEAVNGTADAIPGFMVINNATENNMPMINVTKATVDNNMVYLYLQKPIPVDYVPEVNYTKAEQHIKDRATNTLKDFRFAFSTSGDDGVDNTKWRTKATFGISYSHGEKLVDCGYSMDKLCRDVLDYHVDYQRQSIATNSTHDYTLKTYAPNGLRFLGIAFGVPSIGSPLSSAEAQIRVDLARDYDIPSTYLIDNIEYINENNVIGQNATFEISRVQCLPTDERHDCVLLNINDVLFREQLYYEPFVISAMDSNRYATVHFMNDGILVSGDSLNEAPTHDLTAKLAHQRDLAQLTLTRTDKLSDVWTDQYGHTWTKNSFGTWSYVEIPKITVRPSCTDIDDRVCEAFGKKLDWHTTNMENIRDSLYGNIYTTPAFDSLTEVITLHDVDGDSRAAFLAESAYYLLE